MVTGRDATRQALANAAVCCFTRQTYTDSELVIINDGVPLFTATPPQRIREVRILRSKHTTLGDLRNVGLAESRGDLLIQWDDDDWHHPRRIELQAQAWSKGAAVLLRRQYRYNLLTGAAIIYDLPLGIHGTILHERHAGAKYPSLRKQEDTLFLKHFKERVVIDTTPSLYIRLYHGANTWDEAHVMGLSPEQARLCRPVTDATEQSFLKRTVTANYSEFILDKQKR